MRVCCCLQMHMLTFRTPEVAQGLVRDCHRSCSRDGRASCLSKVKPGLQMVSWWHLWHIIVAPSLIPRIAKWLQLRCI